MLREIKETSRKPGEPRKRWFSSLDMDVFIWLDDAGEIVSYQLTYDKPHREKAVTWSRDSGFLHLGVDDGSRPGKHPGSPLLVTDGRLVPGKLISLLETEAGDLDPWIRDFIIDGIETGFDQDSC